MNDMLKQSLAIVTDAAWHDPEVRKELSRLLANITRVEHGNRVNARTK